MVFPANIGQATVSCKWCTYREEIVIDTYRYKMWKDGELLLCEAFPDLTGAQRELLRIGMCSKCYDKILDAL